MGILIDLAMSAVEEPTKAPSVSAGSRHIPLNRAGTPMAELMAALHAFAQRHNFNQADFQDAVEMLRMAEHPDAWLEFLRRKDDPMH